jgi:riboflavin synthase
MFTGLIEEIGNVGEVKTIAGGKRIRIRCSKILSDLKIDDSVCVNGVCLTAVKVEPDSFWCEAVGDTLNKTTISSLQINNNVHLERALKLSGRLGGHLVQGHVNCTGVITKIQRLGDNYSLEIQVPDNVRKYIVDEGSIAVDGISLTVAEVRDNAIRISIIPHTWNNTTLNEKSAGSKVNIETDILAKYVENLINNNNSVKNKFTDDWFKGLGY